MIPFNRTGLFPWTLKKASGDSLEEGNTSFKELSESSEITVPLRTTQTEFWTAGL